MSTVSAFHCAFEQDVENAVALSSVPQSHLTKDDPKKTDIGRSFTPTAYLFSAGVVVSVRGTTGHVTVLALESANASLATAASTLLNGSLAVNVRLTVDGRNVNYFVRPRASAEQAAEDLRTLGIAPEGGPHYGLNVTVNRHQGASGVVDVFLRGEQAAMNVRYGADVVSETRRVLAEAKRQATDAAWVVERELLQSGKQTINTWTEEQREELVSSGRVANTTAAYIRDVSSCTECANDPRNVKFEPIKR